VSFIRRKINRGFIGPALILRDRLFPPKSVVRSEDDQRKVDEATKGLTLYHLWTCPFCARTRRVIKQLSLNIELRDINKIQNKKDLVKGSGQSKVPCLKIMDEHGTVTWLRESHNIIRYLQDRFSG